MQNLQNVRFGDKVEIDGRSGVVEAITNIEEEAGACFWRLLKVADGDDEDFFVVIQKTDVDAIFILFSTGIEGNRETLLAEDCLFMFAEPKEKDFVLSELEMAASFEYDIGEEDFSDFNLEYSCYGKAWEKPAKKINYPQFCQLSHYSYVFAHMFILEMGGMDEDGEFKKEGGDITVLEGYKYEPN